jgi:Ca2+-binding EF-hand superfamily protein
MEMRLDEEEMISLFKSMDVNNSGSIEYTELIQKFSQLNN